MKAWKMAVAVSAGALLAATSDAATTSSDPAARGLDAFVHLPAEAPAGGALPLQVTAYGFPTVVTLAPLDGATVEAAWDPRTLGPGVAVAPPPVRATAGPGGRVHLPLTVPPGGARELTLLLSVRAGDHARTRKLTVRRTLARAVALHVSDVRVVPGGAATAFALVTDATTQRPLAKARALVELLEGGVARFHRDVTTDAAGSAMVRVPIPTTDDPAWSWTLRASLADGAEAKVTLTPREETPGQPVLRATFGAASVRAGGSVPLDVSVRDASDEPVASLPLRYWVGPQGTEPPKDEEGFRAVSTEVRTDPAGTVTVKLDAPTTVPPDGTTLSVVVRGTVEGHALEAKPWVAVGGATPSVEVVPEAAALVPGLEQRVALRVRDGEGKPVTGGFTLEGDGLRERVTTDARGDAELRWRVPADVGARRDVGPCAGGVAATVSVRADAETRLLGERGEPFQVCVRVDRDATAIVRADRPLVRADGPFHVEVAGGAGVPWSVVAVSDDGEQTASVWLDDGARGGELRLPDGAHGVFTLSAASPGRARAARVVAGTVLALPAVLPKLEASLVGGRAAPGGTVEIEARLSDGHGGKLEGTVAGVLFDLHGGASGSPFSRLDARHALAGALVERDADLDPFLEADGAWDATRRAVLAGQAHAALAPLADPAGTAKEEMQKAFAEVVRSVEGAVFEASQSPERLRDVRRKTPGGWAFNPELLTLATAAMDRPPETPGGEPLALGDLIAVDPQVSFDHVARRITRLKLFRVLSAVRAFVRERQLDEDEPARKDPNAMLRRLVRDGRVPSDLLLDPWGGTMQFRASSGPRVPFLSLFHGFELAAPGPDGKLGTGDDVRDPFERVLRSGTPYAKAVSEDRIVDAKWDMQVSDETVSGWQSMFDELTGTALGGGEGLGLSGVGSGGGGRGSGYGYGSGSGRLRGSSAISRGLAFFAEPTRTDADGKVRLRVPLGDVETTWRLALVALPDHALPATTTLDVPVSLPMSARVEAGARWVAGDEVSVLVTVRNRTHGALAATLGAEAGGVASLVGGRTAKVEVPAGGAAKASFVVRAAQAGGATLKVVAHADGAPDDVVTHAWQVEPAGEKTDVTRVAWIDGEGEVSIDVRDAAPLGPARLVLERGPGPSLAAALDALDPDRLGAPGALADALEVASRVRAFALARGGEADVLAVRAAEVGKRALGRLFVVADREDPGGVLFAPLARARAFAPASSDLALPKKWGDGCPSATASPLLRLDALDAEPPQVGAAVDACWDALAGGVLEQVMASRDPVLVARALLAFAERPHRRQEVAPLADRLRELVALRPSGGIVLQGSLAGEREARALVLAALLRAAELGHGAVASAASLAAWLEMQRDGQGSYGSPLATRSAVRALLGGPLGDATPAKALVKSGSADEVALDVPASGTAVAPLAAGVTKVHVRAKGVVARLERPVLRPWTQPPPSGGSPVHVDVVWPADAKAGTTGKLLVSVRHDLARPALVDVRLPLPPGVTLAAPMSGVRQLQGVLALRLTVTPSAVALSLPVPLRFGLAERVTVPEGEGRLADEAAARAAVAARSFAVR